MVGQLNIAKTNIFDLLILAQLKRLSFSYNVDTKLIYAGLVLTSGNYHNLPGHHVT